MAAASLVYPKEYDLSPSPFGAGLTRIKTIVEANGSLQIRSADGELSSVPLKVHAELGYDQRTVAAGGPAYLRHYWRGLGELEVDGESFVHRLRKQRRLILLAKHPTSDRPEYSSPLGPLRREELELIDVAGSRFALEDLLPGEKVEIGATWEHPEGVIAELMGLVQVKSGHLQSRLTDVSQTAAKIELEGTVTGQVEGVETRIELLGKLRFDLEARMIDWVALSLKERRSIGYLRPGFDVVAVVRTVRQRTDASPALSEEAMAGVRIPVPAAQRLLEFASTEHGFRMSLDRRWHLVSSQANGAVVLRLADQGDLWATCQVDRLGRLAPGKKISLEEFQSDVQHALGSHFEQVLEAEETVSPTGLHILRVVARGTAAEVRIRWIYYHLSNEEGRRLSFCFTHDDALEHPFVGHDEKLIGTVEFLASARP